MRTRRPLNVMAAALFAALTAGCGGPPEPGAGGDQAVVIVDNTATTIADATIHLVETDIGSRRMLGSVGLEQREVFRVDLPVGGAYRLVADVLGRPDIVSNEFTLVEGDVVEWDIDVNFVQLDASGR